MISTLHKFPKIGYCKLFHHKLVKISLIFLLLIVVSATQSLNAQVVSTYYTWSQSLQTYNAGVSSTSTTPSDIFTTSWDDNSYTGYFFPFNFTYRSVLYTAGTSVIGVDTDGWAAFNLTAPMTMTGTLAGGSWISASNSTGVYLNGTANNEGFCGFNSDLQEQTFATITGNTTNASPIIAAVSDFSNIRIGTRLSGTGITNGTVVNAINPVTSAITMSSNATATGTAVVITPRTSVYAFLRGIAPYRQFVIQWTRATRFNAPGDDFSFQLVLNEGGGNPSYQTLQAVYGVCKATNLTVQNAQVGLRGASAADYNARKTATDWSATTAASANTDVCTLTPSVFPVSGLTYTWSPACLAAASNAGAISGPANVCPGTTVDYSIPGVPGATFYSWTYTGGGTTLSGTTTLPLNTLIFGLAATGGTLTVTPGNLCGNGTSSSFVITTLGLPTATISYPASSYCTSAAPVSVTQTGTAGGTYTTVPATGLTINASTGQITPATSTAGTYVITYTFTSGCTNSTSTTVTINSVGVVTASATPSSVCTGTNSQLLASVPSAGNYTISSIAYSSVAPSGSPTVLWNTYQLDIISGAIPLPFTFNFYGAPITQFYVSSEGYVQLQTGTAVAWVPQTLPNATIPNNIITLAWDDLIVDPGTNPGSSVRYFVNGTTPNRILVVDYINLRFLGGSGTQNVTGQIRLYENDNHIEVAAGTVNDAGTSRPKTLGIENSTGTVGITPAGRNNVAWNISAEAWAFYPPVGTNTYSWSPATFLSSTSISNPVATAVTSTTTYTVTVTSTSTGCTGTANTTVTVSAPLNGTYTVGVGGNFTTLTAAVNAYNNLCIAGPVVFSLIDNTYPSETFPIVINSNIYASAVNTLTIKPAVTKTPTITGSNTIAIIKMNGADYVTLDGSNTAGGTSRDLSVINTSTDAFTSTNIWLNSVNASNGATNNTIKNCIVTGNAPTTTFTAIISSGVSVGTVAEAANSSNTYQNNLITKCQTAIAIVGPTGNESTNVITGNTIGSVTAGDKLGWSGIELYQQANALVTNNIVFGITTSSTTTTSGISIYGTASAITISGNKISDIKNTNTTGFGSNGIYLGSSSTAANVNVFNNFVFDVASYGYTLRNEGDNGYGIIVDYGGGYNIYYNTVLLNSNQTVSGYPACLNVTSFVTTAASINIKNNIFTNTQTVTGQRYAIESSAANTVFGTIDYNCYNTTGANLGYIGSNRAALANVQAGFGQNVNSIQPATAPVFVSATDLHINPSNATNIANLDNRGNPIAAITSDYDNQTRNGLTPDLGADEWVKPNYGSWVGKVNIDWLVPANWEANYVPDLTTDVFITGGYTFMPTVATAQAIRNLNLSAPGTPPLLTLNAGTLQVYGTITRTGGTIDGSNGTLEMKGSATQTIPASLFQSNNLKNLIVSNTEAVSGVTLGGTLDIYRSLTFGTGGRRLATGGFLTFKSTATETAWLGQMIGTNVIVGDATIERTIPLHTKAWQFLSTPITAASSQTVKQAWQEAAGAPNANPVPGYGTMLTSDRVGATSQPTPGFDAYTAPGPSIKTYKTGGGYTGLNRTDTAISNPKGYMVFVRGNRSVTTLGAAATATVMRMKGTLHTPANPPVTISVAASNFASVGNPYASAINFRNLSFTGGLQTDFFYLWDPKLTSAGVSTWGYGGFQTFSWNPGTGVFDVTPGGGSYSGTNRNIESGQAFFINAPLTAGTLSFPETGKVSGSYSVNRPNADLVKQLRTNLHVITGNEKILIDGNLVQFNRSFSNSVDINDGIKMNNTGENLGLYRSGKTLAVERRQLIRREDTIYYELGQMKSQLYEFEFIANELSEPGLEAWLEDDFLHSGTAISLSGITRVQFNVVVEEGSYASNRFRLVFKKQKKHQNTTVEESTPISKNYQPASSSENKLQLNNAASITVYPNPVVDHTIQVLFKNQPMGNYNLKMISKLGQLVYQSNQFIAGNDIMKTYPVAGIPPGTYQLSINSGNGINTILQVVIP